MKKMTKGNTTHHHTAMPWVNPVQGGTTAPTGTAKAAMVSTPQQAGATVGGVKIMPGSKGKGNAVRVIKKGA